MLKEVRQRESERESNCAIILNINKLFTFDNEYDSPLHAKKLQKNYETVNFTSEVQSAQYNRKVISTKNTFRLSLNPYLKQKKSTSLERKRQSSLEEIEGTKQYDLQIGKIKECKTSRNSRSPKSKILLNMTIDPEAISEKNIKLLSSVKRGFNSFSENYKNRRKLIEKIGYKGNTHYLKWDLKPIEQIYSNTEMTASKKKNSKTKDSLFNAVEGSKIKYNSQEKKYGKAKE